MALKNFLFTVILIGGFFALAEVLLAVAGVRPALSTDDPFFGFAGNVPLYIEAQAADGSSMLRTAANKIVLFNHQEFPKVRGDNTYRIFCMGGSTTYGRPYRDTVSFCGWLRAYLGAADPGREWEVINAGGISYASYRVARLMAELTQYQPDLFIVYTGQNEFLEQRSYGRLIDLPGWVVDLNAWLSGTRIYTAMSRVIDSVTPASSRLSRERDVLDSEVDEILNHTIGPQSYQRDDVLKRQIMTHFRLNLQRMVDIARDAGVGVVFIQPAVNLRDMSPFKSEHGEGLDAHLRLARLLIRQDQAAEALQHGQEALRIDPGLYAAHHVIGLAMQRQGRLEEAEGHFSEARRHETTGNDESRQRQENF